MKLTHVLAGGLAAVLAASCLGVAARADAAPPGSPHPPAASAAIVDDPQVVASRAARWSGRPVEVAGRQTPTGTVFAEPDGSMRAVFTAVPTRVLRGATWVPLDATLTRVAAGGVVPVATDKPVAFSGGGRGPLVSLGGGRTRLDLSWPGVLPRPALAGSTATYPSVLPGVDLRVTATESGFAEMLVVRDRAAGLRLLASPPTLRIVSPGLTVRGDGHGGLTALDAAGLVVFAAPTATMWDATAGADPGHADRVAPVRLSLAGATLTIVPDRAMITDSVTRYPLFIDPSFSGRTLNWTDVLQQSPSVSFWNGQNLTEPDDPNGPIMVGFDPFFLKDARAMFQMNTSPINGKHILSATFRITEQWANSCTASGVELWKTGRISSATTWNNQPSWSAKQASTTAAKKNGQSGSCGPGQLSFNATSVVTQVAADNSPDLTLGLRAANEGDTNSWKRFAKDATLQVDYNTIATVGTQSTSPAAACVSGGSQPAPNGPMINTPTPTLTAFANDADTAENTLKGTFVWQTWNGSGWVAAGSGTDPTGRAANTQTSVTVAPGLLDATTYRWQVQIADPLMPPYGGSDLSAWSPWCEFTTDFVAPPAPVVTAGVYAPGCQGCGGLGTPDTFTLASGATDVITYLYGFADPPSVPVAPPAPGGSVSFGWTPPSGGPYTLYVQAKDAAGNISAETRYSFTVTAPAPTLAQWLLQEPPGSTTLADTTGNGNTATLLSGSPGAPSRIVGLGALGLDGSNGYADAPPVLDTSRSFSVSAWVRLTDTTTSRTAVSQAGTHASGFSLGYDQTRNRWAFTGVSADTTNPATNFNPASTAAPVPGVWTHLAAVYDAATHQASLYVNGVPQQTQTASSPAWNATGPLFIGRGIRNDAPDAYWAGSLADVEIWQRVRYPSEISAQLDPGVTGLVAANSFGTPGGAGTLEISAPDPLGVAHDLMLQGSAAVPASGAGYQGTGLALDGAGYADSSIDGFPQVLHTDQSFTVSGWVKLTGTALPTTTMTAISQQGMHTGGFFLGYRMFAGAGKWSFSMPGSDAAGTTGWVDATSTSTSAPAPGQWTQLAGVYNATAATTTLFVNGQLVATATRAAAPWDATGALLVGADNAGASLGDRWVGDIDEIRTYQSIKTSPAGDWQFAGCTGTPANCPDYGTGSHALTLSASGASITNTGLPSKLTGAALSLTGTGSATTGTPVVRTDTSFTVGAWARLTTLPTSGVHVIASQSGTTNSFFELQYNADLRQLCFVAFNQDTPTTTGSASCGPDLTAGQWMFVAGVYDQVAGTVTMYTATPGNTPTPAMAATFTNPWYTTATNAALRVGAGYHGGALAEFLNGAVCDAQIFPGIVGDLTNLM